ncbi:MAG: response regulator, partial [Firmicutes bacterium]|nr:response regulator [Bacillota bacterium]
MLHMRYRDGRLELIRRYRDVLAPDHLLETADGTVWIGGTTGMLYRLSPAGTEAFTPFGSGKIILVDGLLEWDGGRVLISSSSGGICLIDQERKIEKLSEKAVFPPFRDRDGRVWACVDGHDWGIITGKGLQIQPIPSMKRAYASAVEDHDGIFWVGTSDGLVRFDPTRGDYAVFSEEDGIAGNEFADACAAALPDGHLVFGGPMGLTLFTPLISVQQRRVPLCFQELRVHNKLVNPGPEAPIDRQMSESPSVTLNHLQNSFSLSYAALDYINGNRISYRYWLEGYDPCWIEVGREHEADYSNIPAGRYTFRVQAMDSAGSLEDCEASISIRVKPDPWRSWWAILLYGLFGLGLLFIGLYEAWLRKQKGLEAEELSRLNAMQMNFFANVAHEFRTPLTMIAGPVSALSASERIAGQDRKMLSVMQRSVSWMLHLVNQILDFNRLEGDRLELKVAKQDIVPVVKEVLEVFRANAEAKGITLSDQVNGGFQLWMDGDKVTKILMNLLSNALKFTPSGGQIEVTMDVLSRDRAQGLFPLQEKDTDNRYVYLSVKDTGPGIPPEQLERIFERFYQLKRGQVALGSGIGLYYSRSLATIHHGYLLAWNRTDGPSGAVFGLLLPASTYAESEKAGDVSQQKLFPVMTVEDRSAATGAEERRKILVVDDDVDIANYLKVMLQPQYQVQTCFDVDSALAAMAQEAPDLVLSDVMMPGKSGYELCDAIKSDLQL